MQTRVTQSGQAQCDVNALKFVITQRTLMLTKTHEKASEVQNQETTQRTRAQRRLRVPPPHGAPLWEQVPTQTLASRKRDLSIRRGNAHVGRLDPPRAEHVRPSGQRGGKRDPPAAPPRPRESVSPVKGSVTQS